RYYNLFESEPGIRELLTKEQRNELRDQVKTAIWIEIGTYDQQKKHKKPKLNRRIAGIAASMAIFTACAAGLVTAYYLKQQPDKKIQKDVSQTFREHRMISLPDGTSVIVSAGSKLKYPSTFNEFSTREVFLEGKAFFD